MALLELIDVVLAAILLLIIFAGYENVVSRIDIAEQKDRPPWMGHVGFSGLKMKLIDSIVAISAIELLRLFMHAGALSAKEVGWKLAIHVALVVSGLQFASMDRIVAATKVH